MFISFLLPKVVEKLPEKQTNYNQEDDRVYEDTESGWTSGRLKETREPQTRPDCIGKIIGARESNNKEEKSEANSQPPFHRSCYCRKIGPDRSRRRSHNRNSS